MMATNSVCSEKMATRIVKVAALRAQATSWGTIAKLYKYANNESARKAITAHCPDAWRTAYDEAMEAVVAEVEAESVLTNRELLRRLRDDGTPRDERIRAMAARSLMDHAAKLRAKAPEQHVTVPVNVSVSNSTAPIPDAELLDACRAAGLAIPAGISRGILDADGSDLP